MPLSSLALPHRYDSIIAHKYLLVKSGEKLFFNLLPAGKFCRFAG